jgi:integrase
LRKRRLGRTRLYGLIDPRIYRLPYCEEASRADRCIDYEEFMEVVLQFYNKVVELRQQSTLLTFKVWSSYLALTLVIMVNGLRVREALRVAKRFYETGERRITIEAVKGGDRRLVVIPEFTSREDLEYIYKRLVKAGEDRVRKSFLVWLKGVFSVNPHSLRYSFIRYHTLTGKTPEGIARALGLREKDNIKRYYLRGLPISTEG